MADLKAKCRVKVSKPLSWIDRLRILWGLPIFVVLINAKAHTSVVLTTRKPTNG